MTHQLPSRIQLASLFHLLMPFLVTSNHLNFTGVLEVAAGTEETRNAAVSVYRISSVYRDIYG